MASRVKNARLFARSDGVNVALTLFVTADDQQPREGDQHVLP